MNETIFLFSLITCCLWETRKSANSFFHNVFSQRCCQVSYATNNHGLLARKKLIKCISMKVVCRKVSQRPMGEGWMHARMGSLSCLCTSEYLFLSRSVLWYDLSRPSAFHKQIVCVCTCVLTICFRNAWKIGSFTICSKLRLWCMQRMKIDWGTWCVTRGA